MNVAVLTLTRDRLAYTKHCFKRLHALAGCDFDHLVLDQGSTDGTRRWLARTYKPAMLVELEQNIGISKGMNVLLNAMGAGYYDVVVKFDNDCELVREGTLEAAARLVHENREWIVSPRILGLNQPPHATGETEVGGERVAVMGQIGGIFMAAPAVVYAHYRHSPDNPTWGMDDVALSAWWRGKGGSLGYLLDWEAHHYETTKGQWERYPGYFAQKRAEGLPG